MSIHRSIPFPQADELPGLEASPDWSFSFPNTADFNFNYFRLLDEARSTGIAELRNAKVAVIGTGIAGATAARELFRCGVKQLDIYEASDRVGGRNYSTPISGSSTPMEMGAMRMPFFTEPGRKGSVLDYYRGMFDIQTSPFPDPHAPGVANTGIWTNDGYGPDPSNPSQKPELLFWPKDEAEPPTEILKSILRKWNSFASHFVDPKGPVVSAYNEGGAVWQKMWQAIVSHYWKLNFRELVHLPAIASYDQADPGNFGGLGMTGAEGQAFYTIGAGDGSWGAFYDISCLFPIRTLLFGYATNHQLIEGPANPPAPEGPLVDSDGRNLQPPLFRGVQSFAECLFFEPVESPYVPPVSLFQASKEAGTGVGLHMQTPVAGLAPDQEGGVILTTAELAQQQYDAVVVTPSTWALQMSCELEFPPSMLPVAAKQSIDTSHWISSTKIFYPLKQRYWEVSKIPQVINTDTFLQDVYGYATGKTDPGVLLLSYTWEDDANKLEAEANDAALAKRALDKLDEITMIGTGQEISEYVDINAPTVFRWLRQPTYHACAKLYRQRSWAMDYALLAHNQENGKRSGLYFAGEGYSVEGGWTEPALRLALDAVIHIVNDHGGTFQNQFKFDAYPRYDTSFEPS